MECLLSSSYEEVSVFGRRSREDEMFEELWGPVLCFFMEDSYGYSSGPGRCSCVEDLVRRLLNLKRLGRDFVQLFLEPYVVLV